MPRKTKNTPETGVALYALGPQDDGGIILRVENDFDLMTLRKAVEKQAKNAQAATGTVSALADGEDGFVQRVISSLSRLHQMIVRSRAPENEIADTPIGQALAEAQRAAEAGERGEPIDGAPDGSVWAPHVPTPRPALGDFIVWPDESVNQIANIEGYDLDAHAFVVGVTDGLGRRFVIAHAPEPGKTVWRVAGALYKDATVPPSVADDLLAATQGEPIDPLVADAPTSHDDDAEDPPTSRTGVEVPAEAAAREADEALGESPEPPKSEQKAKRSGKGSRATPKPTAQRERNARSNGLRGGAKRGGKRT